MSQENTFSIRPDFEAARTQRAVTTRTIALDSGLVDMIISIPGTLLLCDRQSTGYVYAELNTENGGGAMDAITVLSGDSVEVPFRIIKLNAPAQPGKIIVLKICQGVSVRAGNGMSTGSAGVAASVVSTPYGYTYGASYKSITGMAANTPDTVFVAGSNPNGAIVWDARFAQAGATPTTSAFVAKATAPATPIDGDVIVSNDAPWVPVATPYYYGAGKLLLPVKIPAGKGLYYISDTLEARATRSCLYTLL